MISHRVIQKMITVFEEEIARDEQKCSGLLAAKLVRELIHSEPSKGNILSQAFSELEGNQNRLEMRFCIGTVVKLYQSRNTGLGRPTTSLLRESLSQAMALKSRNLNQSSDEESFILRNYSRLGKEFGIADLFRELYPHSSAKQSEIDSFRQRLYGILKKAGIEKPTLPRGRTKRLKSEK